MIQTIRQIVCGEEEARGKPHQGREGLLVDLLGIAKVRGVMEQAVEEGETAAT